MLLDVGGILSTCGVSNTSGNAGSSELTASVTSTTGSLDVSTSNGFSITVGSSVFAISGFKVLVFSCNSGAGGVAATGSSCAGETSITGVCETAGISNFASSNVLLATGAVVVNISTGSVALSGSG